MENKSKLLKYYSYGLLPLLILWILIFVFVDKVYSIFFLIGFTWPYMYHTPGFEEKATSRSYRYSLLGNLYKLQSFLNKKVPETAPVFMYSLSRLIPSFLISILLVVFNPDYSPLWVIGGWSFFEIFAFLNKKKSWDFF